MYDGRGERRRRDEEGAPHPELAPTYALFPFLCAPREDGYGDIFSDKPGENNNALGRGIRRSLAWTGSAWYCFGVERNAAMLQGEKDALEALTKKLENSAGATAKTAIKIMQALISRWWSIEVGKYEPLPDEYINGRLGSPVPPTAPIYLMTLGLMLGIDTCVVRAEARLAASGLRAIDGPSKDFSPAEVAEVLPISFPTAGYFSEPAHTIPGGVLFLDHAPLAFARLRASFGVDAAHYLESLGGYKGFRSFTTTSKSGAFFFFSNDGRYMIKSMSSGETKVMKGMLAGYFKHMAANRNTLLSRFFGMHSIVMPGNGKGKKKQVHFVVMQSIFFGVRRLAKQYDLKGSTVARTVCPQGKDESLCTLKDNNFRDYNEVIQLDEAEQSVVLKQIQADIDFLHNNGLMDYSLLVGIRDVAEKKATADATAGERFFLSADKTRVYYFGVIDVLQKYTAKKWLETAWKGKARMSKNYAGISSRNPTFYRDRFYSFMATEVFKQVLSTKSAPKTVYSPGFVQPTTAVAASSTSKMPSLQPLNSGEQERVTEYSLMQKLATLGIKVDKVFVNNIGRNNIQLSNPDTNTMTNWVNAILNKYCTPPVLWPKRDADLTAVTEKELFPVMNLANNQQLLQEGESTSLSDYNKKNNVVFDKDEAALIHNDPATKSLHIVNPRPDGNCFFAALALSYLPAAANGNAITQGTISLQELGKAANILRVKVVDYMRTIATRPCNKMHFDTAAVAIYDLASKNDVVATQQPTEPTSAAMFNYYATENNFADEPVFIPSAIVLNACITIYDVLPKEIIPHTFGPSYNAKNEVDPACKTLSKHIKLLRRNKNHFLLLQQPT